MIAIALKRTCPDYKSKGEFFIFRSLAFLFFDVETISLDSKNGSFETGVLKRPRMI